LVDWFADVKTSHLQQTQAFDETPRLPQNYKSREKLAWEFAKILNQEARELEAAGVDIIQFDGWL
jgi:methionine synthase II (cobalamin-independent)